MAYTPTPHIRHPHTPLKNNPPKRAKKKNRHRPDSNLRGGADAKSFASRDAARVLTGVDISITVNFYTHMQCFLLPARLRVPSLREFGECAA